MGSSISAVTCMALVKLRVSQINRKRHESVKGLVRSGRAGGCEGEVR